jgi:hypothetical protein
MKADARQLRYGEQLRFDELRQADHEQQIRLPFANLFDDPRLVELLKPDARHVRLGGNIIQSSKPADRRRIIRHEFEHSNHIRSVTQQRLQRQPATADAPCQNNAKR